MLRGFKAESIPKQLDYPLKGPKNGFGLDCKFGADEKANMETIPDENRYGFKLMVHHPFEVVSADAIHLFTVPSETLHFNIVPEVLSYDESLLDFTPEERNCWLHGERQLSFFKEYNRPNCEHECLSKEVLKTCGCVEFYMIRNQSTRICSAADESCFRRVEESFLIKNCKCYHPCERIKYDITLLRTGTKK
jgi:acid-sensing ion channel, other